MKIAVLCNGRLAMPTVQKLIADKKIAALGIADTRTEVIQIFNHLAEQHHLPLQIFTKKKFATQLHDWLAAVEPDVVMVITFPFRIPASALAVPKLGFINFHFGLLPEMRGADPIFETLRLRKTVAGTTVHVMDAGFDTGPIILREELPVQPNFTYGLLSGQLAFQGAEMCMKLLGMLSIDKPVPATEQDESKAAYYPVVSPGDLYLNWETMAAVDLVAFINSHNPLARNGAPTIVNSWTIGVCDASVINLTGDTSAYKPGTILAIDPQNGLLVMTKDGFALKLEVIYTEEGYFPGYKLANFGIQAGMTFTTP